jgi:hypothetical protein
MNAIFAAHMRRFVLIFMDDILVFSKSMEDHIVHLKIVFQTLLEYKLFIKFSKCTFAQQQISYMGHIISSKGVSTDPTMTIAMLNWLVPQNFYRAQGILGINRLLQEFCSSLWFYCQVID